MANERPDNPLDRALRELENIFSDAAHPIGRLRAAVEHQRAAGKFNERMIVAEIEKIRTRSDFAVEDIDNLAARLMKEAP